MRFGKPFGKGTDGGERMRRVNTTYSFGKLSKRFRDRSQIRGRLANVENALLEQRLMHRAVDRKARKHHRTPITFDDCSTSASTTMVAPPETKPKDFSELCTNTIASRSIGRRDRSATSRGREISVRENFNSRLRRQL